MNAKQPWAWDHEQKVVSHLKYLGNDPLTDTRYFWLSRDVETYHYPHDPFTPLVYALFIELYAFPEGDPLHKKHQTQFIPFDDAKRTSTAVKF